MKNLRLLAFTSGSLLAFAGVLMACGDDDTAVVAPGNDASTDTSIDRSIDTGTDGRNDGDAGRDATPDAPIADAGLKLELFARDLANAVCDTLSRCCYGAPSDGGALDGGGTFDRASCVNRYSRVGFEGSLTGFDGILSNASIDQQAGSDCLQKVRAMSCNLPGTEFRDIRGACFAAVKGKAAAGQPCKNSVDCAPGTYCQSADAGPGTCAPLVGSGGNCGYATTGSLGSDINAGEQACSWRGGGETKLYCTAVDLASGPRPKSDWKCAGALPNGSDCFDSRWCSDGICDPDTLKCTSPVGIFPQAYCGTFVK